MSIELETRTFIFAKDVRSFCRKLKRDIVNLDDIRQLVRCSGSVGANYIEANENLGKADMKMRIRISRKEAKEAIYWLKLLQIEDADSFLQAERIRLADEGEQLKKIFSAILNKLEHLP